MEISSTEFLAETAVQLENEAIRAIVLPSKGGKVVSLLAKDTGMEILFQNPKKFFRQADFGSDFGEYEACGFDDAFPNIDAEWVRFGDSLMEYPDHGEIWSASFFSEIVKDTVSLLYDSERFHYRYRKKFSLKKNRLVCSYEITNNGKDSLPCIWTMHCLVNKTPAMRLIFPHETKWVQNVFANDLTGAQEAVYPFPEGKINGRTYRFDRPPASGMVKYYVWGKVSEGYCGYDYPETGTSVRLYYEKEKLPYLGCWATAGGYRGDSNCALEPSTGYYDSVKKAKRLTGFCPEVRVGETFSFSIEIELGKLK